MRRRQRALFERFGLPAYRQLTVVGRVGFGLAGHIRSGERLYAPPLILGAVMDVVVWLRSLGLGKYEAVFRENEIDETVLPSLTR